MNTKHTRGPWLLAEYGGYSDYEGRCRVILGEGGDIRTAVVLGFDTPENAANARLIAAAPELLEALKAAKMPLELYNAYGWPDRDGVRGKVKAAIAKATGSEA